MTPPVSTYRLQLTGAWTLYAAAGIADYLHALGADWIYCSPLLAATPGSDHGYDVVDPARVDPARGGPDGLRALSAAARTHGLGVLVDIVPNHMGVSSPADNPWWWDVLRRGRDSPYADFFDIDWDYGGGRLRIPVLGDDGIRALRIEDGELRYHEHRYPVADGTGGEDPAAVHERQHYELVHWSRADSELNYRRFFAVSELAALRVEKPEVFYRTHGEIFRWLREGLVDGLRVDHPDGLADPGGYLDRLAEATGGAYVVVEKILEPGEALPPHWAAAGTTGYDALAEVDRVLVDSRGRDELDRLDAGLRGADADWPRMVRDAKRGVARGILRSELRRLVRDLLAEQPDAGEPARLEEALAEIAACFPVYRSYLPSGREHLDAALAAAESERPDLSPEIAAAAAQLRDPRTAVARRFQQTSGMVMAKGVEDTAFYRISRLASLTEVGGDPAEFAITPAEFHIRQQQRLAAWPLSMTALSTHDTKRGEDTRARIAVLAEIPAEWAEFVARRRARNDLGDGPFENLLWQSIVGSWPREREALHGYAEKAAREAGTSTTWARPDARFEARMHALVDSLFDEPETRADVEAVVARVTAAGWSNGLSAKLLQLTGPGVPDVYQGSELWERSLVDPDNRRPVDFELRRRMLSRIDGGQLPPVDESGAAKLLVTSRALRARRDRRELFHRYLPLPAAGPAAGHVVAVDRGGALAIATRLPLGLAAAGGWGGTAVLAARGSYVDALTGRRHPGGALPLAGMLDRYPVALLLKEET